MRYTLELHRTQLDHFFRGIPLPNRNYHSNSTRTATRLHLRIWPCVVERFEFVRHPPKTSLESKNDQQLQDKTCRLFNVYLSLESTMNSSTILHHCDQLKKGNYHPLNPVHEGPETNVGHYKSPTYLDFIWSS